MQRKHRAFLRNINTMMHIQYVGIIILVHKYIHTRVIISYLNAISTPILGQIYIVIIYIADPNLGAVLYPV